MELYHQITQFLYREARMLDNDLMREWLTAMVDPEISYQVVMTEERFRRDKAVAGSAEVKPFDDDINALELRVRHFETGLQSMMDPPQRLFRTITNIEAFHRDKDEEYLVFSHGLASRFRRQYEHEQLVFSREDVLRRAQDGGLRILSRRIVLPERVARNKNLLFFI